MTDLATHIANLNASNEFCTLETDVAYWNERGIYTPAHLNRYLAECAYSDGYKEVYGVRPRNGFTDWTDAELDAALADLENASFDLAEDEEYLASLESEAAKVEEMNNPAPLAWEAEDLMYG